MSKLLLSHNVNKHMSIIHKIYQNTENIRTQRRYNINDIEIFSIT